MNIKETKAPNQNTIELKTAEQKFKNNNLNMNNLKRRKEGEEKAHEDGCMVG